MLRYVFFKEVVDRSFALFALLFLSPVLGLVSLLVLLNLGSPVFFFQRRPGLYSVPFCLIKFRTMSNRRDSSGILLPDSDRLTPFGSWLRSSSFDELPALINIVRGEMSFIGPRPLLMQYLPLYSSDQLRRHDVKPGFTGLAQIKGRNSISWEEKFFHDVYYVDNQGFWLDLRILLLTIWIVFRKEGISAPNHSTMPFFKGESNVE